MVPCCQHRRLSTAGCPLPPCSTLFAASTATYVGGIMGAAVGAPGMISERPQLQLVLLAAGCQLLAGLPCCKGAQKPKRTRVPAPPPSCAAAVPMGNDLGAMAGRMQATFMVGQLSIPALPANYRTTADQLSYMQMDFP